MAKKKKSDGKKTEKINPDVDNKAAAAHDQADKDIERDPDLASTSHPEDLMDEGELARLEGED